MTLYLVASSKDWFKNRQISDEYKKLNIIEISNKAELNLGYLRKIKPRFIFFPHWSWRVDSNIYQEFECVVFHTAPLPYGRGGSPIQNLIINKFKTSPVCALKMTDIIDGGPIYKTIDISLHGTISEIFSRIAYCIESLIILICNNDLTPEEQSGNVFNFKRMSKIDNELQSSFTIEEIFDRIRMVDGEDYPRAFIKFGDYCISFSNAELNDQKLIAQVRISKSVD